MLAPAQAQDDTVQDNKPQTEQTAPAVAQKPKKPVPQATPQEIAQLISDLDSDSYQKREAASERLAQLEAGAIPGLSTAASGKSLEAAIRAVQILEKIYVATSDTKTIDLADATFEKLRQSKNRSVASRADHTLLSHYKIREKRAIAQIKILGGSVTLKDENTRGFIPFSPGSSESNIQYIVLGRKWKGGEEGLKYVKRLTYLTAIYFIRGAPVPKESVENLQAFMPNLEIQYRDGAYLGVSGQHHDLGCQVRVVKEGGAAEKGGLLAGDIIVEFNEKIVKQEIPVENFQRLITLIGETKPGDKVKVSILRNGKPMTLVVTMAEWR